METALSTDETLLLSDVVIRCWTPFDVSDAQRSATQLVTASSATLPADVFEGLVAFLSAGLLHVAYEDAGDSDNLRDPFFEWLVGPKAFDIYAVWENMQTWPHDPFRRMEWVDSEGRPTKTHPTIARIAKSISHVGVNRLVTYYSIYAHTIR